MKKMNKEQIRKLFSSILIDSSEKNPLKCYIPFGNSYGLSSLELPTVVEIFQQPEEGIIWFKMEGIENPIEFDDLDEEDLNEILSNILNDYN